MEPPLISRFRDDVESDFELLASSTTNRLTIQPLTATGRPASVSPNREGRLHGSHQWDSETATVHATLTVDPNGPLEPTAWEVLAGLNQAPSRTEVLRGGRFTFRSETWKVELLLSEGGKVEQLEIHLSDVSPPPAPGVATAFESW